MSKRETPQAIHDRAAEWVARLDRADANAVMHAELEAWLGGDARHRGAFFRAQAAWAMLDRARAFRGASQDGERDEIDRGRLSRRWMLWGGGSLAAASLAALALASGVWQQERAMNIETAIGEIRRVPLSDGSLTAVNTQTKLSITLTPAVRRVDLAKGEAWFQVAKNPALPFVVEVGEVRVQAIGTAFSVRRAPNGAQVQVTEGMVKVWRLGDEAKARHIAAGGRTFVSDTAGPAPVVEASVEIDRALAWRNGQLIFEGDTLAHAVAEFNRYNRIKLNVADASLGRQEIIGRFRTNEPEAFARATTKILNTRVAIDGDRIVLSRK